MQTQQNQEYTIEDLKTALAIINNVDLEDPEIDPLDELIIDFAFALQEIDECYDAYEAGEITKEEANVKIAETLLENSEENLETFGLEIEVSFDEQEDDQLEMDGMNNYSRPKNNLTTFSSAFTKSISNLIAADYDNLHQARIGMAQATGLDISEVDQVISGQCIPDLQTAENLSTCFSATKDPRTKAEFMSLVQNALIENTDQPDNYQFSNNTNSPDPLAIQNSQEIERIRQEINNEKSSQNIETEFDNLILYADQLIGQGKFSPHEKNVMFGNYEKRENRLALFSRGCDQNNIPYEEQLNRMKYALDVASRRNPAIQFSSPLDMDNGIIDLGTQQEEQLDDYATGFFARTRIK